MVLFPLVGIGAFSNNFLPTHLFADSEIERAMDFGAVVLKATQWLPCIVNITLLHIVARSLDCSASWCKKHKYVQQINIIVAPKG